MIGAYCSVLLDTVDLKPGSRLYADQGDSGLPNGNCIKEISYPINHAEGIRSTSAINRYGSSV